MLFRSGSLLTVAESVTTNFVGGPATVPTMQSIAPSGANDIIITWSSVEGGRYDVQAATNLAAYSSLNTNVPSGGLTSSFIHTNGLAGTSQRFYRTKLAALANYDSAIGSGGILSVVPNTGLRNNPYSITINLDPAVGPPPQMAPVLSVTVGSINGTSLNHVSQTQVTASISIPGGATPGPVAVSVTFPGPPENPSQTVTYTLTNGFTIQ